MCVLEAEKLFKKKCNKAIEEKEKETQNNTTKQPKQKPE